MDELVVGENFLIRFNLKQQDKVTNLNLAACSYIAVSIINNATTVATYVYNSDPELTEGDTPNQLVLEGKTTLSLSAGSLRAKLTTKVANVLYPTEQIQCDKYYEDLYKVVNKG